MYKRLLFCLLLLLFSQIALADKNTFQVEINAAAPQSALLKKHLQIIKWRDNPRMTAAEWQRLFNSTPQEIKALLATEGYFTPTISSGLSEQNHITTAKFDVTLGVPVLVGAVEIQFTGEISQQDKNALPNLQKLRADWPLKVGNQFKQDDWDQAKRQLLTSFLIERYPNATITHSQASIHPATNSARLLVTLDSGAMIRFATLNIKGLKRYPASVVENLNPIKTGSLYSQSQLLTFQTRLQESGYFSSVEVTANTKASDHNGKPTNVAPITVTVNENRAIKMSLGAGYSTNTGARTQITLDDLNLFNRGWRMASSLKLEQKAQVLTGQIRLPTTQEGYRDSISGSLDHTSIEGQAITSSEVGVKRAWGGRKREQYVGANLLTEHVNLDGAPSSSNYAATMAYGITLRRTDNELNPTRGYLLNAQMTVAPLELLSNGRFVQSKIKAQGYYPITDSTQLIARAELGLVNGKNSAPAAFLFRAGGDQSIRGYAYQSLGVTEGDATVGGRYVAAGSIEVVQWLTNEWGIAAFTDFGNAANTMKDLKPVLGYGLGARWKSPVGPIGADIAYGQETDEYRMHFNIGVAF
ncbi:MAG: outer membrane protein assembly factor [Methylotenera sp.]|nr:outer membrane protein assembly factor [Methylotenera sp.]